MTTPGGQTPAADGWVTRWLGGPRYAVYLVAAAGDPSRALALYEWNSEISAALLRDLAHVEVALRNAYDRALSGRWPGPPHWTSAGSAVFPPLLRTRSRRQVDVNARSRDALQRALTKAGGPGAPAGKVIAELTFGFWRYLSSAAHEKSLWVPALHRAFRPGTDRQRDVDGPVGRLHELRNRVAHHEPLLRADLAGRATDAVTVTTLIDTQIGRHLTATSRVSALLTQRP